MTTQTDRAARSIRNHQIAGALVLAIMVAGLGGWSAIASISGAVIAPSIVVVETNAKQVQHLEGGIVSEINVTDGTKVKAGDLLIRLDATQTRVNLAIIDSQLNEFLARRDRLIAERDGTGDIAFAGDYDLSVDPAQVAKTRNGQRKLFKSRVRAANGEKEQLGQRIRQLNEEIRGLKAQQKSRRGQLTFIDDELTDIRDLSRRGLVPKTRLHALEREAARLQGDLGQFIADIARANGRIAEIHVQTSQVERERLSAVLTELRDVHTRTAELLERRTAALSQLKRIDIFAPRTGYVHNLTVHTIGGVIAPREPLLSIIPEQDALQLEARVKPNDIHRVYSGQSVAVRFSSLSASTTPELKGTVSRIPAAVTETDGTTPPYYLVRISLSEGEFAKLNNQQLKPGMPAEVFIETGERKAISYLIKPFTDALPNVWRGE